MIAYASVSEWNKENFASLDLNAKPSLALKPWSKGEECADRHLNKGHKQQCQQALGYIGIGLACGIMAAPYMNPLEMGLMSILVYAGSAQFAMIGLFAQQAPVLAIALTFFLINIRHLLLLSACIDPFFRKASLMQNIIVALFLTDESYES